MVWGVEDCHQACCQSIGTQDGKVIEQRTGGKKRNRGRRGESGLKAESLCGEEKQSNSPDQQTKRRLSREGKGEGEKVI